MKTNFVRAFRHFVLRLGRQARFGEGFEFIRPRGVGERAENPRHVSVALDRREFCEKRLEIRLRESPRGFGLLAVLGDRGDEMRGGARDEFVGDGKREGLRGVPRIQRTGERAVE